jgi:hypothetical protein
MELITVIPVMEGKWFREFRKFEEVDARNSGNWRRLILGVSGMGWSDTGSGTDSAMFNIAEKDVFSNY